MDLFAAQSAGFSGIAEGSSGFGLGRAPVAHCKHLTDPCGIDTNAERREAKSPLPRSGGRTAVRRGGEAAATERFLAKKNATSENVAIAIRKGYSRDPENPAVAVRRQVRDGTSQRYAECPFVPRRRVMNTNAARPAPSNASPAGSGTFWPCGLGKMKLWLGGLDELVSWVSE